MSNWPLLNRNKVEDSKVIICVQSLAQLADPKLSTLAQQVRSIYASKIYPFLPLFSLLAIGTVCRCTTEYLSEQSRCVFILHRLFQCLDIQFRMAMTSLLS